MRRRIGVSLPIVALAAHFAATAFAQAPATSTATTMRDLLAGVEGLRDEERAAFEKRRSDFNAEAAARQTQLLNEATQNRNALNTRSESLSGTYSANEVRIRSAPASDASSTWMAESAPIASAFRRTSVADAGPIARTTTSAST